MRSKIQKWGNSFALRIPKAAVTELNLTLGVDVEIEVRRGKLIIKLPSRPRYRLRDLLRGIKKSNMHGEIDMGPPVGKELF